MTLPKTLRPCLKVTATDVASTASDALARTAMTDAVCEMSSGGKTGFGPCVSKAARVPPPSRSSSALALGEPKRAIW